MQFALFEDRLIRTFSGRTYLLLILFFLLTVFTFVRVIYYHRTNDNHGFSLINYLTGKKKQKLKLSTKQQIGENMAVLVLLAVYIICSIYPVYQDIRNQQYIQVHGQYKRTELSSESNFFSNGYVYVYKDGERLDLALPANWNADEYPLGEHSGTIWYSKESKVILAFEFD